MHGHKPSQETIREALENVLASVPFARSAKQSAFLRFVVEYNGSNQTDTPLSSFSIATDCFNRSPSDPNDAYVRNIASQTRKSLKSYYDSLPQAPDAVIQLAEKGYQITCQPNAADAASTLKPKLPALVVTPEVAHKLLPTIAVIPLRCASGNSEHAVLGHMLSDSLTTSLAKSKYMRVISRRTSAQFDLSNHSTMQLGEMLNADYLVDGQFYVHGGTLRVQVELSSCSNDEVIWADQIHSQIEAVVSETDELVEQILYGVTSHLLNHELQRALSMPLASLQCHSLLIGSINIMHRGTTNDIGRARDMLELLADRNPLHAAPYAHLACLGVLDNVRDADYREPKLSREFVQENTEKALSIDSQHAIALTASGAIKSHFERDFSSARTLYEQAIQFSPNEAATMAKLSVAQLYTDSTALAFDTASNAIKTSPFDPELYFFHSVAATTAFGTKRYSQAIIEAEKSRALFPKHLSNLRTLVCSYMAVGNPRKAKEYAKQLLAIDPNFSIESYRKRSPFPHNETIQRLIHYLTSSGLPVHSK